MAKATPVEETPTFAMEYIDPAEIYFDPDLRTRDGEPSKDRVKSLAASIGTSGQDSPIGIFPWHNEGYKYKGIWGEHRREACLLLGIKVLAIIRTDIETDADVLSHQWDENAQRVELTPMDRYHGVRLLMDRNKWNQKQAAAKLQKSPAWVTSILALGKCQPAVQEMLRKGEIAHWTAVALNDVPENKHDFVLGKIKEEGWNPKRIAEYVANLADAGTPAAAKGGKNGKPGKPKAQGGGQKNVAQVKDVLQNVIKSKDGLAEVTCTLGDFSAALLKYVLGKAKGIDAKNVFEKLREEMAGTAA